LTEQIDRATARKTTLTVAAVSLVAGAWQIHRQRPTAAVVLLGLGVLLTFFALLVPAVAVRFHRRWMYLAECLGYVNTRVLLTLVFYGLLTPMRVVFRMAGHDPLARRAVPEVSYWQRRAATRQSTKSFEHTF
jgi:hypothetical protein